MENPEVPMEKMHEHIEEHAHESKEKWVLLVALSTAIIAVLAAVTSLLAGKHADEAMASQIESNDQWSYYQSKGIKAAVLETRIEILDALGHPAPEADKAKLEGYKKDQEEIQDKAKELTAESKVHALKQGVLARGVTMFQIAIAIAAIAVLTKRRRFFGVSLLFSVVGIYFLVSALIAH